MTISLRSLRQQMRGGATALAWASCILVIVAGLTDLQLTIAHESGTRHTVYLSDVFGTLGGIIGCLAFAAVGAFVLTRRPGNRIGWLMLAFGLSLELAAFASDYPRLAVLSPHRVMPLRTGVNWVSNWSLDPDLYLLLLFPTGRLLSPHLKPVVWIGSVAAVVSTLIDMFRQGPLDNAPTLPGVNPFGLVPVPNAVHAPFFVAWLGCILVAAASLVRRFWISRGMERQQLKWFTYAIGLLFASFLVDLSTHTWSGPLGALLLLAVVAIPVSMGIAILRYRLYDIDLLINRTLVYGVLTATLAGLYVGQVIGLQAFFRVIAGQQSELAVAISTLVIAILFNPLRHRVQSFIDRRFYRQKYDAARAMTAFQSRLRDEVDLERLTADLVQVVHDTVQPVMVSVWLRDAGSPMHEARGE